MHLSSDPCFRERKIMEKSQLKYVIIVLAVVVSGLFWYWDHGNAGRQKNEASDLFENGETSWPEAAATDGEAAVYVHIVGAVKKPGVYKFEQKPRVIDVVERAGGFAKGAVKADINQAETVEDGSQIVIQSRKAKDRARDAGGGRQDEQQTGGLLDINTATKEELMTLTGIGESKALSIVAYRETNGKFKKIEDIMNITGIKSGIFDKIKDQIKV